MCSRFVIVNSGVSSVLGGVLDHIEVAIVYGALHGVKWVGIEQGFQEGVGDRVTLRRGI